MAIKRLHPFLETFFTANHCDIMENNDGVLTVRLTEAMDRALMNRPFYWHYVKKMGYAGEPMELSLITNPEKLGTKGEYIHFGSPRLQQIIHYLKEHERFAKLFEQRHTTVKTALYPWLVTNIKISYIGKQRRDEIVSIGLHLINGIMKLHMMETLEKIPLQAGIPDYCFTISPIIKLKSGYRRIEKVIEDYIQTQSHAWAKESLEALEEEISLLEHFYTDRMKDSEQATLMEKEKKEIMERLTPTVSISVVNAGLFYLTEDILKQK